MIRQSILTALLLASTCVNAQTYRWIDDKGRVQFGDAPPASAKAVTKTGAKPEGAAEAPPQLPFEVLQAQKDFPVTLYSAPICKQPCDMARAALNKRGVPFTEVQVWTPETLQQLKSKAGSDTVPALMVGRSALSGFDQARYDGLLDSAGYPKQGAVAARAQRAPEPPAGYEPPPQALPVAPEATISTKPGPYDTSGLPSNRSNKPGPYVTPVTPGAAK